MFIETKKIIKRSKREVTYKIITSLFIQLLALIIPVFWSNTINEVTEGNYKIGYYLIIITLLLSIFYYFWSYLNQKTWFKLYNKLYTEYTNITISEIKNINKINLGEYTNILNNDIDIICNFLGNLITRILQIIEFFVIYAYFLSFNFIIFIVTIVIAVVLSGTLTNVPAFIGANGELKGLHIGEVTFSFVTMIEIAIILLS